MGQCGVESMGTARKVVVRCGVAWRGVAWRKVTRLHVWLERECKFVLESRIFIQNISSQVYRDGSLIRTPFVMVCKESCAARIAGVGTQDNLPFSVGRARGPFGRLL